MTTSDWVFSSIYVLLAMFFSRPFLHSLQLSSYSLGKALKTKLSWRGYWTEVLVGIVFSALWCILLFFESKAFWGFMFACFFFVVMFSMHIAERYEAKKPLVYTKRIWRLLLFSSLMYGVFVGAMLYVSNLFIGQVFYRYLTIFLVPTIYPLIFSIAHMLILPFENLNKLRYEIFMKSALNKRKDLIKIAITGSYGKTSVKNYLDKMLSMKYQTLVSESSFNTPMGLAMTVKKLNPMHEIFIAEMGARHRGDISHLMKLIRPDYGILTGISNQHLETFKTMETIEHEKLQVVFGLDKTSSATISKSAMKTYQKWMSYYNQKKYENKNNLKEKKLCEVSFAGIGESVFGRLNTYATNLHMDKHGSCFVLHNENESVFVSTKLLGRHNVENLVVASDMALKLGVSLTSIKNVIENIAPTPHRLELVESNNGITIIDDSFNSNSVGAKMALDVLEMFDGRKIVLTSGLVELGKIEFDENEKLGEYIAKIADFVILVGKQRSVALQKGLQKQNFSSNSICICKNLKEAKNKFSTLLHIGDNLLLLNDLPDNYEE